MFIGLLTSLGNGSNRTKCVSLTNQNLGENFNSRENSQHKRKFSTQDKMLNSQENSQLKRKLPTQEKITNLGERYW